MAEDNRGIDYEEEEDEEERKKLNEGYYEALVTKAAGQGNMENIKLGFSKKPECIFWEDKNKKWTPIIWAASKNHIDILKFLIENGALKTYLEENNEQHPSKCTLGIINQNIKPNPLQWACFQGNLQIVWYLIKQKCRWQDVDQFGNNCVHLAASGGNVKVFQALLMHGVDTDSKNSRNHSVLDLATNKEIINLVNIHMEATKCTETGKPFEYGEKKYWCQNCNKIFCEEAFRIEWTWETPTSEEKERIDGKCKSCWNDIAEDSKDLEKKMEEYNHSVLSQKIEDIDKEKIDIDLKLLDKARQLQEQLRTQNVIIETIENLKVIPNYKTIFKSVHILREMKEDASKRGVTLDQNVVQLTDKQIARLLSERKLRYDLDNMNIGACTPADKAELTQSIEDAKEKNVANNYLEEAEVMREKMEKSLDANEILRLFQDYKTLEEEQYPLCFYRDKKTQKVFDPYTKKPADSKKFPPPKKKKKKKGDPKLVIPEWAAESPNQLREKIKTLEVLLQSAEDCKFEQQFIDDCQKEIKRMNIELKYRDALQIENELIQEFKNAQKGKKK